MDSLKELKDKMEQLPLKKVWFGGYSKEDVMLRLDMIYALFEKHMKDQAEREASMLAEFETQIQELKEEFESTKKVSNVLIDNLNHNINDLNAQNELMGQEQKKMQDAYDELVVEKNNIEKEQAKIKQERDVLQSEHEHLVKEQLYIKEENNMLLAEKEQMVREQYDMREAYRGYCKGLLKEYSESLCALSGEFSRILENVSNMQKEIDEEKVFKGLEQAVEMVKREVFIGTVEETVENPIEVED